MTRTPKKDFECTASEVYSSLCKEDQNTSEQSMGLGDRKIWLGAFMSDHLPGQRLQEQKDDLSAKYESIDCSHKRKRRRSKLRAAVLPEFQTLSNSQHRQQKRMINFKDNVSYAMYCPLRDMWLQYMEELISFSSLTENNMAAASVKLMKADLHGCPLKVSKSKCPSLIGLTGIVIQETKNMFVMVTPDDRIRRIPKANSIFSICVQDYVFTIYGNQFCVRPGERASRKFKQKSTIDL